MKLRNLVALLFLIVFECLAGALDEELIAQLPNVAHKDRSLRFPLTEVVLELNDNLQTRKFIKRYDIDEQPADDRDSVIAAKSESSEVSSNYPDMSEIESAGYESSVEVIDSVSSIRRTRTEAWVNEHQKLGDLTACFTNFNLSESFIRDCQQFIPDMVPVLTFGNKTHFEAFTPAPEFKPYKRETFPYIEVCPNNPNIILPVFEMSKIYEPVITIILRVLKKKNVFAVFLLAAHDAFACQEVIREIHAQGHQLGVLPSYYGGDAKVTDRHLLGSLQCTSNWEGLPLSSNLRTDLCSSKAVLEQIIRKPDSVFVTRPVKMPNVADFGANSLIRNARDKMRGIVEKDLNFVQLDDGSNNFDRRNPYFWPKLDPYLGHFQGPVYLDWTSFLSEDYMCQDLLKQGKGINIYRVQNGTDKHNPAYLPIVNKFEYCGKTLERRLTKFMNSAGMEHAGSFENCTGIRHDQVRKSGCSMRDRYRR